jgi:hypothetical protein
MEPLLPFTFEDPLAFIQGDGCARSTSRRYFTMIYVCRPASQVPMVTPRVTTRSLWTVAYSKRTKVFHTGAANEMLEMHRSDDYAG